MITCLTAYELKVLREIDRGGSQPDLAWGAAMSEALEFLQGQCLIKQVHTVNAVTYIITPAGKAVLG